MSQWGNSDGEAKSIVFLLWAGAILVALGVAGVCAAAYWLWG